MVIPPITAQRTTRLSGGASASRRHPPAEHNRTIASSARRFRIIPLIVVCLVVARGPRDPPNICAAGIAHPTPHVRAGERLDMAVQE